MKKSTESQRVLSIEEAIKTYCKNAKTVAEVYKNNEAMITNVCSELEITEGDVLLTCSEVESLIDKVPQIREHFKQNIEIFILDIDGV